MPIHPATQAELSELEKDLLARIDPTGVTLSAISHHLSGLFNALKQVDAPLEHQVMKALRDYFYEKEQEEGQAKKEKEAGIEETETTAGTSLKEG